MANSYLRFSWHSYNKNSIQRGLLTMKKKLFCILGLILIASAIAYFCRERSELPLSAENADYMM